MRSALDMYFHVHIEAISVSISKGAFRCTERHEAPCQICGRPLERQDADPCHKFRRWKGLHGPEHILAGHRDCHTWLDNKAHSEREKFAQSSPVSCATGGVVDWPLEMKAILEEFLTTRIDRINLRNTTN